MPLLAVQSSLLATPAGLDRDEQQGFEPENEHVREQFSTLEIQLDHALRPASGNERRTMTTVEPRTRPPVDGSMSDQLSVVTTEIIGTMRDDGFDKNINTIINYPVYLPKRTTIITTTKSTILEMSSLVDTVSGPGLSKYDMPDWVTSENEPIYHQFIVQGAQRRAECIVSTIAQYYPSAPMYSIPQLTIMFPSLDTHELPVQVDHIRPYPLGVCTLLREVIRPSENWLEGGNSKWEQEDTASLSRAEDRTGPSHITACTTLNQAGPSSLLGEAIDHLLPVSVSTKDITAYPVTPRPVYSAIMEEPLEVPNSGDWELTDGGDSSCFEEDEGMWDWEGEGEDEAIEAARPVGKAHYGLTVPPEEGMQWDEDEALGLRERSQGTKRVRRH